MRIKAKSDGLDLYSHSESVKDTTFIINNKANFGLDIEILKWSSLLHDIGKANPLFQKNMNKQNFDNVCRHEISSILFIDIVPVEIRDIVGLIILSHHKSIDNDERSIYQLYECQEDILFNNHINKIEEWGLNVQKYLLLHYNIVCEIPSETRCREIIEHFIDIIDDLRRGYSEYRGLLMMADHFASCFSNDTERLDNIDKLFEIPDVSCYNGKNDKYPLSLIDSDISKRHTFCIAPTGAGKTNFMMKRTTKRVFYTLPFQASINAMYCRFKNDIGNKHLIGLKHSSLNTLSIIDEKIKTLSSFYGLPVKVITPFQIMSIILRLKGYETIIMDLKGQDVIFDELHTYNSITQNYIFEMIKLLDSINCSIHICTATMPSCLQEKIISLLGRDKTQIVTINNEMLDTFNRHIVHTKENFDIKDIKKRYENGEKVLIVRNQISKAQEIYGLIKEEIPEAKKLLLHSRFKRTDRNNKEKLLIEDFNKKNEPCIVVSTQVVEVSIDINFDVLFTDCADIMCLIQRFGRINRQRVNIGLLKDVFIIRNNSNTYKPYDENVCKRTFEILSTYEGKVLEERKIQSVIDYVYPSLDNRRYDSANPYNENNEWKSKMFSNVINNSLSKELDFEGYVGILSKDMKSYVEEGNNHVEIPLSFIPKYSVEQCVNNKHFCEIPNTRYDQEYGLLI